MRKKILLEKRDALRSEAATLLAAEAFPAERATAIETELAAIETELASIEALEARIAASATSRISVHNNAGDAPWRSNGEFLRAVVTHGQSGAMDPRLAVLASGSNEGVGSEGAFLVQPEFASELLQETYTTGILASRVRKIPLSGNNITINGVDETSRATGSRYGGIQVYRAGEAVSVSASKPAFKQIKLSLKKMMGLFYATDELLEDQSALEGLVRTAFPSEFGFMMDSEIMSGNGVGQMLGYWNGGALVSVAKVANQVADTVVVGNITSMWGRLHASCRPNAVWLINQDVENQLPLMTIGNMPVYLPTGSVAGNQNYGLLMGRPVIPCEQCETLGDKGDIQLVDLSKYIMVTKGGVKTDVSMHVRFLYAEQAFRFILRNDGAPLWSSPITPYKGSNSLSPFVTLDARA